MAKKFYITTTLPYVNDSPHIGFALEIIQADTIARYHHLLGDEVFFNTGTDEHGLKIYSKALEEKKDPQAYVDEYAAKFDDLKKALNLSYNSFIRTTDKHHLEASKEFWRRCNKNGDIYKDKQKIKYCVGCELEKTDSELVKGKCPLHSNKEIEIIEEENYFFRFSKYQQPLLDFYRENPSFIIPQFRLTEIKNFVQKGLKDFSISRLKEKMPWGVDVPDDSDHVMYVWFDALINYISAIGWPKNQKEFAKWWPVVQVAGKDNLRQQSAIWQAMLMSASLPNSKQILIHGFINSGGQKMSKSLGNVIDPFVLVKKYGTDAVRYYLLKEIPPVNDGDFTIERFEEIYNADLANGIGNLVQRIAKLAEKINLGGFKKETDQVAQQDIARFMDEFEFHKALNYIWTYISELDKYIDRERPWEQSGSVLKKSLSKIIKSTKGAKTILKIAALLRPFLPATAEKIEDIFTAKQIKAPAKPLFPRIK